MFTSPLIPFKAPARGTATVFQPASSASYAALRTRASGSWASPRTALMGRLVSPGPAGSVTGTASCEETLPCSFDHAVEPESPSPAARLSSASPIWCRAASAALRRPKACSLARAEREIRASTSSDPIQAV